MRDGVLYSSPQTSVELNHAEGEASGDAAGDASGDAAGEATGDPGTGPTTVSPVGDATGLEGPSTTGVPIVSGVEALGAGVLMPPVSGVEIVAGFSVGIAVGTVVGAVISVGAGVGVLSLSEPLPQLTSSRVLNPRTPTLTRRRAFIGCRIHSAIAPYSLVNA